jgi:hypothetical protein
MELDFSQLMALGTQASADDVQRLGAMLPGVPIIDADEENKPEPDSGLQRLQRETAKTRDIYRKQAECIRRANAMPADIIRGVQAGEDIYGLFLKAVECIGMMEGDTVILPLCKAAVKKNYLQAPAV